jgi:hypothetical protein
MISSDNNRPSIILDINNTSYMAIYPPRPVQELCMCDCASLVLQHPTFQNFTLEPFSQTNPIFDILMDIKACTQAALKGLLQVDHITQNIGYIYCNGLHNMLSGESAEYDLVKLCAFAHYPRRHTTFLYEKAGSFFLEVAPLYPWECCDPEPHEQYYSYEDFMASYASILQIPIERSVLEKIHVLTSTLSEEILAREMAERTKYYETHTE